MRIWRERYEAELTRQHQARIAAAVQRERERTELFERLYVKRGEELDEERARIAPLFALHKEWVEARKEYGDAAFDLEGDEPIAPELGRRLANAESALLAYEVKE